MEELKKCPFCGNEDIKIHKGGFGYSSFYCIIKCETCTANVSIEDDIYDKTKDFVIDRAIKAWNRRCCDCRKDYEYLGIDDYIRNQPTAFDLENIIKDFESKLECTKMQLEVLNDCEDKDSLSVKNSILFFRERAERYEEFLKILKSIANATNRKNGG